MNIKEFIIDYAKDNPDSEIIFISDTNYNAKEIVATIPSDIQCTIYPFGVGGVCYGHRANMVILYNAFTLKNAHEHNKQLQWLQHEVYRALPQSGRVVIVNDLENYIEKELK